MKNDLPRIPDLPNPIVDAVNHKSLAVFLGAGVSRLCGCLSWDGLCRTLLDKVSSFKTPDGSFYIDASDIDNLMKRFGQKKVLTICYEIFEDHGKRDTFYEILEVSWFSLNWTNRFPKLASTQPSARALRWVF